MNNDEIEVFARLSMHEFLLEIAYANALGPMAEADRTALIAQILSKIRYSTWTHSEDGDAAMALQQSMIRIGEQFFAKVTKRL